MAARVVRLFPEAEDEVQLQELWYARRSERAAQAFLLELDHALERIAVAAEAYPLYRRGTRRFVMHRFPYSVVYRIEGSVIYVVAVANAKRRPEYWRGRKIP